MIYLDYNATTPIDPAVQDFLRESYAHNQLNPGSITHAMGRAAAEELETARAQVAASIAAEPRDMVFCHSATEALNIVIRGVAQQYADTGKHIICSAIEHTAVHSIMADLAEQGFDISYAPVDERGYVLLDELRALMRDDTMLCVCMHVNNEIGTIQDIKHIAELCQSRGVKCIVDAAQSWGKISINVQDLPLDALVLSAHKAYGPQGVAALYLRRKPRRLRLQPILFGGGQERGLSPGTVPLVLVKAMAKTAEINQQRLLLDQEHVRTIRAYALEQIAVRLPDALVNGDVSQSIAGTLSLQVPGIDAQQLLCSLPDLCLAMGSACTSSVPKPSHVLRAIGLNWQAAAASLRISFGRFTTKDEMDYAIKQIAEGVAKMTPMTEAS